MKKSTATDVSDRCKKMVWDSYGYHSYKCSNKAKQGGYCGIHDPEAIKLRKQKRGPTKFERGSAARADRAWFESRVADALAEMALREPMYVPLLGEARRRGFGGLKP